VTATQEELPSGRIADSDAAKSLFEMALGYEVGLSGLAIGLGELPWIV
jgi:hypothetical protein